MGRAERRHHSQRMKSKARRIWREIWGYRGDIESPEGEASFVQNADHLKVCNGPCCKNVRRSGWVPADGKTHAELHAEAEVREHMDAL